MNNVYAYRSFQICLSFFQGTIFDEVATTRAINMVLKADVTKLRFTVNHPLASMPQFLLYPPRYSSNLEFNTESSNN